MKLQRITILALSMILAGTAALAAHHHHYSQGEPALGIVTGSKTGTYIAFGRDIAAVAQKDGLTVNVYDSRGSIDNIKRITSKEKAGLAIVQSDVLGFLSRSQSPSSKAVAKKLRLVAPLFTEEVHVLARKNITSLADLNGKRVVVGNEGSGSMITAVNIFSTLGITPAKMFQIDPTHGVVAVLTNDVDAMVFVGGKPVKMFKNMEDLSNISKGANANKLDQVHFIPLNDPRLQKEYKPAVLSHADYSFIAADVPTVAVTAVLITYDYSAKDEAYYHLQCQNMGKLVHTLHAHMNDLKANGHPKWKEVDLDAQVSDWQRDTCSTEEKHIEKAPAPARDNGSLEKDLIGVIRGKP